MSAMKRLFQVMADKKASDIFLSVGSPINIRSTASPSRSTRRS
jgi:Tfp pilus assembly ATPase PilU